MPRSRARYDQTLHWMHAARHALVPWHEFKVLDRETQGQIVAAYEIDMMLDYLTQVDAAREAQRRQRRR